MMHFVRPRVEVHQSATSADLRRDRGALHRASFRLRRQHPAADRCRGDPTGLLIPLADDVLDNVRPVSPTGEAPIGSISSAALGGIAARG
jgi:hypothetical protein